MPSDPASGLTPEDHNWRPSALQAWWAGLSDLPNGWLRKWMNPGNQSRIHLANLVARFPGQIAIGPYTYGRPKIRFPHSGVKLTIGRFGSIGDGVEILLGGSHRMDWVTTYPFADMSRLWPEAAGLPSSGTTRGDVTIGADVWIGSQAFLLSGITVGHGAVIAARAVVSRDVPPYAVVAGNPAKVVRMRFDEARIEKLLASRWWLRPEAEIRRLIPILLSDRFEAL